MLQLLRDQSRGTSNPISQEERVGQFIIKEKIGQGTTGLVKLAINTRNGSRCAVKIINKTVTRKRKEARKEIKRLQQIKHDNIIALQQVEEDINNIYIFLEYCEFGDLAVFIEKNGVFDEHIARKLFAQLLEAVDFCHKTMLICHHDIKLENCVITRDFRLKLIDYGFSIDLDPNLPRKKQIRIYDSSPAYSPLEILLRKPHSETVDIYSMGICLYHILVGKFPFCVPEKTSIEELCNNIANQEGPHFPKGLLSPSVQHLICRMLSKRKYRISIEEMRSHEWLYLDEQERDDSSEEDQ
eukprot:TRINITY_DN1145_c0_g1_i1.p1 TRINITY_DN1145_c0_g1~~TRINITY_DN1145_c0_g1_i1.p1  ORF type:complete len:298 (+),score=25.83 TRINITY_DN1145_c0_g1_i1:173-1066(+)